MLTLRALLFGLNALIAVFVAFFALAMPSLTRRDVLFGVTVAPGARATTAGRGIVLRYRAGVVLLCVVVLGAWGASYALAPDAWLRSPWLSLGTVALEVLVAVPFVFAHYAARALAVTPPVAPATPPPGPSAELRPRHYSDYLPWIWEVLPIAVIAATVAYLAPHYADAPAIIATHFDLAGNPNRFAPKSIGSYFALVWVQLFIEVILTGSTVLVVGAKAIPGAADELFRKLWIRRLYAIKVLVLALLGSLAMITAGATAATRRPAYITVAVVFSFVVIILFTTMALALRTGQGGARLGAPNETATDRTSDRHWTLGVIYINRDDPAILVEQRFGVGWTLNFGNPRALLVLGTLLALTAGFIIMSILVTGAR
ncbi:MAG TPA: DUF5808 domain-containing protein [Ktedonobacterales bacterium]|jgi:uncharacterized membrane protein